MELKENIYILDDVIETDKQLKLVEYFEKNYKSWYCYDKNIAHNNVLDVDGYKFPAYTKDVKDESEKDILDIIKQIEVNGCEKANLKLLKNYRYKMNAFPPIEPYPNEEVLHRQIHTDTDNQHIVLLYYVNTAEGDTCLFRNKLGNTKLTNDLVEGETKVGNFQNIEKIAGISPKQGRLVIFDGSLLHSPGWPKTGMRYVINYNLVIKTESKNLV